MEAAARTLVMPAKVAAYHRSCPLANSILLSNLPKVPLLLLLLRFAFVAFRAFISHRFTRSFPLKAGTTFGQLLQSLVSRGMEEMKFRKLGTAYLGCRDGVCVLSCSALTIFLYLFTEPPWLFTPRRSQAVAAWSADGYLMDPVCREDPQHHILQLLQWRYFTCSVPADLGSDEDETCNHPNTQGVGKSVSNVDRAIWPTGFMHVEHEMLTYNQPPPDKSTA
ncbi:hypothetical protein NMY22_g1826 [Coprinellus aureogranulatus]|nr:hypothetical protein NMY22_g1826 [Coprinellus aureogranulatus]